MTNTLQSYPSLSLMSLQDSPQASHFFNAFQTRLTTDQIPNQGAYTIQTRILKHSNSKESSICNPQPRPVSTKKTEINSPGPALKNTPANEKFLKFLKDIKEERVNSEQRLQKTVENFTKLEEEPKEKLKWKKMVETGQYIGSRGQEKKDIRLSGRALSREKNFQSMRKKMTELKYEIKNSTNVIKHLTSIPPTDASNLAQPILPFFDGRPAHARYEVSQMKDMSSLDIEDVKHELVDVHFDTIDSPVVAEKDFVMTYNKEQLKKLKGGINYMNRWIIKNRIKSPGASHRSNKILKDTPTSIKEGELASEPRENSMDFLNPLNDGAPRRKSHIKKPRVQEREKVDPHEEFLKRLGISDLDMLHTPKTNFFATSKNMKSIRDAPYKIELTTEDETQGIFVKRIEPKSAQASSPYFFPERFSRFSRDRVMSAGLNESDVSKTIHDSQNSTLYMDRYKTLALSQQTSAGLQVRTSPMNRSYFSPKSSALTTKGTPTQRKWVAAIDKSYLSAENEQMMSKYNHLSNECESSVKVGSEIQMSLKKDYAVLAEKLTKMNQVQSEDWFIDQQIKNDIFAEMQNPHGVTTKLRKKANNRFVSKQK